MPVLHVIEADDLDFARWAARVRFAKAMLDARLSARREGWSDELLCKRIGWTIGQWRSAFADVPNLTLEMVSDVLAACSRELSVEVIQCEPMPLPILTADGQPKSTDTGAA